MTSHRDDRKTGRWASGSLAAIGAFLLAGAVAAPAAADSNFSRGFEDQLGRIVAYEAVSAGKHLLFHGVVGAPYPAQYGPPVGYGPPHSSYRPVRFAPQHNHWRDHDHDRHYYRDRDRHGHGYGHDKHRRHDRHDRHCRH